MVSSTWPFFLLIPAFVLIHLFVSPYTKVEESFNIQAIHDVLVHGIPTENVDQFLTANYDHVSFPGSVPRTFAGAAVLSGLSRPWVALVRDMAHVQVLVRAVLGLVNAASLIAFGRSVQKAFGTSAGIWTLPNMFAFVFSNLALRSLLLAYTVPWTTSNISGYYRLSLYLLTIAGVVLRSELAILVGTITVYLFITRGISITRVIIPAGIGGLIIGLVCTVPLDSFFWQSFPLWPEWTGFYYNTIQGHSADWGVSPWYYYFANALPRLMLNPMTYLVWLTAVAADGAAWIWTRRTKSVVYAVMSLALVASVLVSFVASTAILGVSSLNYPGGEALHALHKEIEHPQRQHFDVYFDNLACQTGVTRFLESHRGPQTVLDVLEAQDTLQSRTWNYDKTEDPNALLDPMFWAKFDYVLAEKPEKVIGSWAVVHVVYGFGGVKLLKPGEESGSLSEPLYDLVGSKVPVQGSWVEKLSLSRQRLASTLDATPLQRIQYRKASSTAEYCEFGGTTKKCEEWLEEAHPDLHSKLYSAEALQQNMASLSVDAQKRAEKDAQKKAAKAATAEARAAETRASSKILIKRIERNKRKYVTAVQGLEAFGLDIKKVAKDFGKKFATGSSVTKIPGGGEEITVQGDLSEDILEFLVDKYDEVPEDNVELIEDKKKKKAEGG
ncbi:glycosyltransferase family 22 protein [Stemphylium lycopersici]|nr:glycosyltransferase family 22 protein [Stemphylium lycopersici]